MIRIRIITTVLCLAASFAFVTTSSAAPRRPITIPLIWRTTGPGVVYPDATDPLRLQPRSVQLTFACIRRYESRNHLVDGDGSQGWYQFTLWTWTRALQLNPAFAHFPPTPNQATGDQQSAVAIWYYQRNGRFGVQWSGDQRVHGCPGVFFFG